MHARVARPPRIPGYSYTGRKRYFLTICSWERREHFREAGTVSLVLDQIVFTAREQEIIVVAYCAMPDHWHLLVDGATDRASLTRFAKLTKQRAGYRFKKQFL